MECSMVDGDQTVACPDHRVAVVSGDETRNLQESHIGLKVASIRRTSIR